MVIDFLIQVFHFFYDLLVHLDSHLNQWVEFLGAWTYVAMFIVILLETGLVAAPLLPGDSLLFALGTLSATAGSPLQSATLAVLLSIAAILGGLMNYSVGRYLGPKVFQKKDSRWFNPSHLLKAQAFYDKHGVKTIFFARFLPFIRTFAPFVAGVAKMPYGKYFVYNFASALIWIFGFIFLGYFFGNIPVIKRNFGLVIPGIIVISVLPIIYEFISLRLAASRSADNVGKR